MSTVNVTSPCTARRNLVKTISLATTVIFAPFVITPSRSATRQIVISDLGGVISQVYEDLFYKPFTQKTGIKIVSTQKVSESTTEARMMVDNKRYLWDMTLVNQRTLSTLTTGKEYLEKHGLEDDPVISAIPPQFRSPYGVGRQVYSCMLAYRTDRFKEGRVPESWEDLWDVEHFPGRRGLRKHPFDTAEIALMADGVSPSKVYPCDLDRVFRSLDKIKSHIAVWWTSGPQTEQLLKSGEVDLTSAWLVRIQSAVEAGAPFALSWNQHLYDSEDWAILKGTPNADMCRQFIQFASDPKRQALLAPYAMGPTHPDAFKYIDPKRAKLLPTYPDNLRKGLRIDAAYWAKHQDTAIKQFDQWMLT